MNAARTFSNSFFDWLYPSRCALCSALGDDPICETCLQDFEPIDRVQQPFDSGPLKLVTVLYRYHDRVGQAVRRLKYSRATALASPMGSMMKQGLERNGLTQYDLVVPIPIHWSRRCVRGFNQSELLSEDLDNVDASALTRVRRTKPQARLSREQRLHNLIGAFKAGDVEGKSVLLIDDVLTSGETVRECARTLAAAGASEVAALAFAGEAY